ncbi:sensor histidine kinase [Cesiribacter andamanensis]|uniref:histidine kinase n=1 Tax=Cesiribacter andamanensis AMV16 TaxID=1279009 RepID=M7N206_9BACT|nr:HAMP domain-containing sensor histidine kinase [Cesiribacter andamanensis]EMR01246.1 Phytochrome-like protein cph1 [Cesiribacter andamanensis AMV16]
MSEQTFLQQSLRIRYEALSTFASALSRAQDQQAVAQAVAVHAKYVLDVYKLRIYYRFGEVALALELFRGGVQWPAVGSGAPLELLEAQLLQEELPRYVKGVALKEIEALEGTFFGDPRINSLYSLPLQLSEQHSLVLSVASKESNPYSDPDFRFIRLMADLLSSKFSQLLLLRNIETKNEEMAEVNHELVVLNEEIRRLNLFLEEKVQERTTALQRANEELNTIFYRTSHDFRRPLTTILGLANVARHITRDPEVLTLFQYAEEAVGDLNRMLEKLKDLSYLTTEERTPVQTDIGALLAAIQERYKEQVEERGIRFSCTDRLKKPHYAPEGMMYAILENLLENSIFYCGQAPQICLWLEQQGEDAVLNVQDNGQGIPAQYLEKVLEMYVRAHESTRGNGLGLYVVRRLVEQLQGQISISSRLGEGTLVQLRLPLQQS